MSTARYSKAIKKVLAHDEQEFTCRGSGYIPYDAMEWELGREGSISAVHDQVKVE